MKNKLLVIGFLAITSMTHSQGNDPMFQSFQKPPQSAKPRVWWHWMNGNITKEGIQKDLLWMHQIGIGGFQNFDAAMLTPQIVPNRLTYMTPTWKEAFKYATKLADSLHLEMAIAGSPGWSETGGPWVKPEDGMKKPVWSEIRVMGGQQNIVLPKPYDIAGPFQNIPKQADFGASAPDAAHLAHFYKDVAVIAFKLPAADKTAKELGAIVTASGGAFSLDQLTDGDLNNGVLLPRDDAKGFAWILFSFPESTTIKGITMVGGGNPGVFGQGASTNDARVLESSNDGIHFNKVITIEVGSLLQTTISFPAVNAKYFRVKVNNPPPTANAFAGLMGGNLEFKPSPGTLIQEIVLHPADRLHMFEEKAAFTTVMDLENKRTRDAADVINQNEIIDLSDKMDAQGRIQWTVPAGNWKIMRFGYSLMGIENHPASPEATGFEVDKMDPGAINRYFTNYLDQYKNATGGLMGAKGGLQYMVTDSYEAGAQNWTASLPMEFQKRRGYSLLPWLPTITGHIIKSAEATEAFLFDFRKTIGELTVEHHYDDLTTILAKYGMKRYTESHEDERRIIADGMEVKRKASIPMAAMWTPNLFINGNNQHKYTADIRESASVAHIYGQNIVAAESFTALGIPEVAWSYSPENLKSTADLEFAHGLNRFVIHCSPHQPLDDKIPGLGLGPFGQWFTRHETWSQQAKYWIDYLARSSYLLQQGKFVADIAVYYGEDNNITSLYRFHGPAVPEGFNYDFVNADIVLHELKPEQKMLRTKTGMQYKVLFLDTNAKQMSLDVLRKIKSFVDAGVVIVGVQPIRPTGLNDDKNTFTELVQSIWSSKNKNVLVGKTLEEVMASLNIQADVLYTKDKPNTVIYSVHRKTNDRDIYWVNNRTKEVINPTMTFRVSGKVPELWFAETGKSEPLSYTIENGVTKVQLHMEAEDALFIVFKNPAIKKTVTYNPPIVKTLATIEGAWELAFQEKRGAPAKTTLPTLASWTTNEDKGIQYFSGTATYLKTIQVDAAWLASKEEIWLHLGDVKNIAEVFINEKAIGTLWKAPFRINISNAVHAGENKIEIKVTNLWVNRLIGDAQPDVKEKITYTTMPFYSAKSKLLPAGLLGPVTIQSLKRN